MQLFVRSREGTYWFWGGVNRVAVGVCALGMIAYFSIYDPFTLRASAAFPYFGAALPVLLGTCAIYYGAMRLVAVPLGVGGYRWYGRPASDGPVPEVSL